MEYHSAIEKKKEHIWVSSNEGDEARAIMQREVSQKEKDNTIY